MSKVSSGSGIRNNAYLALEGTPDSMQSLIGAMGIKRVHSPVIHTASDPAASLAALEGIGPIAIEYAALAFGHFHQGERTPV